MKQKNFFFKKLVFVSDLTFIHKFESFVSNQKVTSKLLLTYRKADFSYTQRKAMPKSICFIRFRNPSDTNTNPKSCPRVFLITDY
jgi:hypothetical protein